MLTLNDLVEYLKKHLGQKPVAYIAGFENVEQLKQINSGVAEIVEMRLNHAYEATRLISGAYDDKTAKSWFFGTNTGLENRAPAFVLRHSKNSDDLSYIIPLAKEFSI
ncbi:hypothetical protein HZA97_03540 [Candidatus Woesearchaeota archaeon]|nr:hypothetical protein [Candidatus Woesearchaeota archaeon]